MGLSCSGLGWLRFKIWNLDGIWVGFGFIIIIEYMMAWLEQYIIMGPPNQSKSLSFLYSFSDFLLLQIFLIHILFNIHIYYLYIEIHFFNFSLASHSSTCVNPASSCLKDTLLGLYTLWLDSLMGRFEHPTLLSILFITFYWY